MTKMLATKMEQGARPESTRMESDGDSTGFAARIKDLIAGVASSLNLGTAS